MYSAFKRVFILSIIFVVILAGISYGLLNINKFINENKGYILSQIEESTGRSVSIDNISLNIWGGLGAELTGFVMKDDPAFFKGDFVNTESLLVNLKLLPLLKKDIQVKRIILNKPTIRIIKNKAGVFNFSTIASTEPEKDSGLTTEKPKSESQIKNFNISLTDITDGLIQYIDAQEKTAVEIKDLDLSLKDIGLKNPVSVEMAFSLLDNKQNIKINGNVGPIGSDINTERLPIDLNLNIDSLNVKELKKIVPKSVSMPQELDLVNSIELVTDIKGNASELSFTNLNLNSSILNSGSNNFSLKGDIGPVGANVPMEKTSLNLDVNADQIETQKLVSLDSLKGSIPKELFTKGPVSFKAKLSGNPDNLKVENLIFDATNTEIFYGKQFNKPKSTAFTINSYLKLAGSNINIAKFLMNLGELKLNLTGDYNSKTSQLDMDINTNEIELAKLHPILPDLKTYALTGLFKANTKVKGSVAERHTPAITGSVSLANASAKIEGIPKPITGLNSDISFTGNTAKIKNSSFNIGSSKISLLSEVDSISPLSTAYVITSPKLLLSDLVEGNTTDEHLNNVVIKGKAVERGGEIFATADLTSDNGKISKLAYNGLNGSVIYQEQVANLKNLNFNFLNASMNADGVYDMSGKTPKFSFNTNLQGLNISDLIRSFINPSSDHIKGNTNLRLNISGAGDKWETIKNTLNGSGKILLTEGELTDFNIAEEVLTGITGIQGLGGLVPASFQNKYPQIFSSKNTTFYNLDTILNIQNGRINFNDLVLKAQNYLVDGGGWIDLDSQLKYNGTLNLSRKISNDLIQNVKYVQYLANRDGELQIPFNISGIFPKVSPKPDVIHISKALQGALVEQGKQELEKKLMDKIIKPEKTDEETSEDESQPQKSIEEQLLEEGLKKLPKF